MGGSSFLAPSIGSTLKSQSGVVNRPGFAGEIAPPRGILREGRPGGQPIPGVLQDRRRVGYGPGAFGSP